MIVEIPVFFAKGKTAVFFHNLHSSGSDFYYYYRNTLE